MVLFHLLLCGPFYRHKWHVCNADWSFASVCLKTFHLLPITFKRHPHSLVRLKWLFVLLLLPQLLLLLLPVYPSCPHTFNSAWYRGDTGQKFTHYHENEEFKTYHILLRDLGIFQVKKKKNRAVFKYGKSIPCKTLVSFFFFFNLGKRHFYFGLL